nr:MAG: HlyD family efflux transporter periplasmic adaptor subunit [Hyphomicrobiales bacterium]
MRSSSTMKMSAGISQEAFRVVAIGLALGLAGCNSEAATGPEAGHVEPARVENARPEADLATVYLSVDAERRLGIETTATAIQSLGATRTLPGEIIVPQERTMSISAPFAAIVTPPPEGAMRVEGANIGQGEIVLQLQPLPGDGEALRLRADARFVEQQWQAAQERVADTRLQFEAGEMNEAQLEAAESNLAVAQMARDASNRLWSYIEGGGPEQAGVMAITIASPRAGILQTLHVSPGQAVSPGEALFDIVNQNVLWVKVPVYAGEIRTIDRSMPAHIQPLGRWGDLDGVEVRPLAGPLTGDTNAASVDLFYLLNNAERIFNPAERVSVVLPVTTEAEALVVPLSAIWRDIHGGEWVYQNIAPQTYARRRVSIARSSGDFAVLASGPPAGTMVATVGVAELAGTEFGVPH